MKHEGVPVAQPAGQGADGLDLRLAARGAVADEPVGQPVEQGVEQRLPLKLLEHDDARAAPVVQEQGRHEQQGVPGATVPAEDEDRPGLGRTPFLDVDLDVEQPGGDRLQSPQPPGHEPVVPLLERGRADPGARAGDDPEPEDREEAGNLVGAVGDAEGDEAQAPATAGEEVADGGQEEQDGRGDDQDDAAAQHHRREDDPANKPRRYTDHVCRPPGPHNSTLAPGDPLPPGAAHLPGGSAAYPPPLPLRGGCSSPWTPSRPGDHPKASR